MSWFVFSDIDEPLVEDTIRRFLANSQYLVLKAPKSLQAYLEWAAKSPHIKHLLQLERSLIAQQLDLGAVWHSVGAAVYPTHCIANHSCDPNATATSLQSETHQITLVAQRYIAPNEEISISYLKELDLPKSERQQVLMENFSFECKCPKCISEAS